ncbi:hypothetical protein QW131_31950 [Roseibium salinum]|nr:hypothetical protein [Roseibium salinum]
MQGPIEVIGGASEERGLVTAVILPGELNPDLPAIPGQGDGSDLSSIDTLNIYDDGVLANRDGVLTSTNLSGFGMSAGITYDETAFGEPSQVAGGITYGNTATGTSTMEVFNLFMGEGNDDLLIESTLLTEAEHGGITVIHGGGNRELAVTGEFVLADNGQTASLERTDGGDWAEAGFAAGQLIDTGLTFYEILGIDGAVLNLATSGTAGNALVSGRVAVVDPDDTSSVLIGGDRIVATGGGGPLSPLVIFGDTSSDGVFYSREWQSNLTAEFRSGEAVFAWPLANPFRFEGNDIIDASALFAAPELAGSSDAGVSIHGGGGNDVILGTQIGDHLTGGSGDDRIIAGDGPDHVYGDSGLDIDPVTRLLSIPTSAIAGSDEIDGDGGADIIFGDHGIITQAAGTVRILTTGNVVSAETVEPANGAPDVIRAGAQDDWVFGGNASDNADGGSGNDILFGDHGYIDAILIESTDLAEGGSDIVTGGSEEDIVIGGTLGDRLDGQAGDDLIFGDAVRLDWSGDPVNPRFRTLQDGRLFDDNGDALVDRTRSFVNPDNVSVWADWEVTDLHHSAALQAAGGPACGNDYIAGGADDDIIFGQLGDDVIQGDGSIDASLTGGADVGAVRSASGLLVYVPSFDASGDGGDYIEGNGGNDTIFGNFGQDDIVGGSSELFSLTSAEQRPDGEDIIFGGSGTRIGRNEIGDTTANGHASDADVILADNGNIYRIVGEDGSYLTFNYDTYSDELPEGEGLKIVPRAIDLVDYTIGGAASDIGGSDLVFGGTGDDIIHGMTGNDVLYGDGRDDDLYGGTGHDRLFGGSGEDGMLGDDGLIRTERNGTDEPLYDLYADGQKSIGLHNKFTGAVVDIEGRIKKTAVILDPATIDIDRLDGVDIDATPAEIRGYHDILYGGLGDDWMHGGYGDDAMSGAEALANFYLDTRAQTEVPPIAYDSETGKLSFYDAEKPAPEDPRVLPELPCGGRQRRHHRGRQGPHVRRYRQRLDRWRNGARPPLRRCGRRPAAGGRLSRNRRRGERLARSQRLGRLRLWRRRTGRSDCQHRVRPPVRLDGRVQHLRRSLQALRPADHQSLAGATSRQVPDGARRGKWRGYAVDGAQRGIGSRPAA